MKRFFRSAAALALLLGLPHCPPARTPEPVEQPSESDASLPLTVAMEAATPIGVGTPDASEDANADSGDAGVTSDASSTGDPPVCSETVLGQSGKYASCADDSQCGLGTPGCCAPCGEVQPDQLRAMSAHGDPACSSVRCPRCVFRLPPGFAARCIRKRCNVVQTKCEKASPCPRLRTPRLLPQLLDAKYSACHADGECALAAKSCCNCGISSEGALVAYSRRTPYSCAGSHDCPDCVDSGPDPAFSAVCVAGRCRVKDTGLDSQCLLDERDHG